MHYAGVIKNKKVLNSIIFRMYLFTKNIKARSVSGVPPKGYTVVYYQNAQEFYMLISSCIYKNLQYAGCCDIKFFQTCYILSIKLVEIKS